MADKKQSSRFTFKGIIDMVRGDANYLNTLTSKAAASASTSLTGAKPSLYSNSERGKLLSEIAPAVTARAKPLNAGSVMSMVKTTASRIGKTRAENMKILKMVPEIFQAAEGIIIPSILSPNDLSDSMLNITIGTEDNVTTSSQRENIRDIILNHFDGDLDISSKLFDWIYESMYKSGAKCLVTIPISELDDHFNNSEHFKKDPKKGVESINTSFEELEKQSLFGLADTLSDSSFSFEEFKGKSHNNEDSSYKVLTKSILSKLEELNTSLESMDSGKSETKKTSQSANKTKNIDASLEALVKDILSTEAIKVVDNPDVLKKDFLQKRAIKTKLAKGVRDRYKQASMLTLGNAASKDSEVDHPLFLEIATESVIPIGLPNSKKDHIGYIILLDEKGYPIGNSSSDTESEEDYNERMVNSARQSPFDELFKAYSLDELKSGLYKGDDATKAMSGIYQNVVEHYLKQKFAKNGFGDVEPSMMTGVYRHLFFRYLEGRQTRLLYVPKEFMQYICFEYNEDGTGASILEKFKFVLALRVTLLVANTMATLNDSINRKTISVTFPDNVASGDAVQILGEIEKEATRKETFGVSHDPRTVYQGIGQKSLTVKAENLPGLNGFNVNHESTPRQSVKIDGEFNDDIKNLIILMQGIPPSAFNSLSETEFSRSVATVNILFARMIKTKQKPFCRHVSKFIQTYLRFDGVLKKKILAELKKETNPKSDETDKDKEIEETPSTKEGTVSEKDEDTNKVSEEDILYEQIVSSVRMILPEPTVSPSIAQFNNLNEFLGAATQIFNTIFSDDIVSNNPELADTLRSVRAHSFAETIKAHIQTLGFGDEFPIPDLADLANHDITDIHQILKNLKAHVEKRDALLAGSGGGEGSDDDDGMSY